MLHIKLMDGTMLDLRRLQCFAAVAQTEHVGAAAEMLHISPSPLSRQIRQLEDELGVKLFDRRGKRLQITSSGREFLRLTQDFLERSNRLERDGKRLSSENFGSVTVGYVQEAILVGVLSRAIKNIKEETKISTTFKQMRTPHQLEALKKSEIDIGILIAPPRDKIFETCIIAKQDFIVVFSRKHDLSKIDRVGIKDLIRESWVGPPLDIWLHLRDAFSECGDLPTVACETFDIAASLALVSDGIGFTIVPANMRRFLSNLFKTAPIPISTLNLELHAVCLKGENKGSNARFLNALQMGDFI